MNASLQFAQAHWEAICAALSPFVVAGICTMPPDPIFAWIPRPMWTWTRDTLQTAIPAARHAHPITPAEPAQPK